VTDLPRVSIVTSAYNQGAFIKRTIDSVLAQNYPDLEHIVVDAMSTDETPDILRAYPHLKVIREKDSGQAEGINKGFRLATGQVYAYLNSDDTFEPGALHRAVREIDPSRGRHVVMGRCRFIDEHDRFIGIEHPSAFESHRRVLEIWKGYTIPQPAVFWTPEVWKRSGPMDENEQLVLDYDLFCRFSRDYTFHCFDQIVANYRLHTQSKTQGVDDATRLRDSIRVSRRYWRSPFSPFGAAVRLSHAAYVLDRRGRAYRMLLAGKRDWLAGRRIAALANLVAGAALGPGVALQALAAPVARRTGGRVMRKVAGLRRRIARPVLSPQTQAWLGFHSLHPDQWAGPVYEHDLDIPAPREAGRRLVLQGFTEPTALPRGLVLDVSIGDAVRDRIDLSGGSTFSREVPLDRLDPGRHRLVIRANCYVVPHNRWGSGDYRPLSYRLTACAVSDAQRPAH
jgi:glycosyltransferase involved in cell wall biosynthesis